MSTESYQDGYKNGYAGTKKRCPDKYESVGERYDYVSGYLTGGNDYNDEVNKKVNLQKRIVGRRQ